MALLGGCSDDDTGPSATTGVTGSGGSAGGSTAGGGTPAGSDGLLPLLSGFTVSDSHPSRLFFESSEAITGSTVAGFTLSGKSLSEVVVEVGSTTGHYFTVAGAFDFWDNHTIRYAGGSDLRDLEGNGLQPFDLHYVVNDIPEPSASTRTLYVDGSVASSGSGTTEASAKKTLSEAAAIATAGTTIWIKAYDNSGDGYGTETVTLDADGTATEPVKILGYRDTIGDLDGVMYFAYAQGRGLTASEMPLFRGAGGTTTSRGLTISGDYTIVKNLQITGHDRNFVATAPGQVGVILDNCLSTVTSRVDPSSGSCFHLGIADTPGTGSGSSKLRIVNSVAVNGEMHNFFFLSDFGLLSNNRSYQDSELAGGTDYLYLYRGSDNIARNLVAHRNDQSSHSGHGYALKSEYVRTEQNLTENATAYNIFFPIEARHAAVRHNVFRNISCTKSDAYPVTDDDNGGIKFTAASYNTFDNIYVKDAEFGIRFGASTENDGVGTTTGDHNVIKNSVFVGCNWAVHEAVDTASGGRVAEDNEIVNCTFHQNLYVLYRDNASAGSGNRFVNCLFDTITSGEVLDDTSSGFTYDHVNFSNLGFPDPSGTEITTFAPDFVDAIDLVPQNAELNVGTLTAVKYDRYGRERDSVSPTLGAIEID